MSPETVSHQPGLFTARRVLTTVYARVLPHRFDGSPSGVIRRETVVETETVSGEGAASEIQSQQKPRGR